MAIKRENSDIVNLYRGDNVISKAYRGDTLIYGGSSLDPDAQAFITATGITDGTIISAIDTLVVTMKADGVWTKMIAVYPFVGGTAFTHKFNLKNPIDSDAAFRLAFNGGLTHSSTGVQGNGTDGWANTFITPNVNLTNNDTHWAMYSRVDSSVACMDISAEETSNTRMVMHSKWSNGSLYSDFYNNNTNRIFVATVNSSGLIMANRTSSTVYKVFRNGSQLGPTDADASTGLSGISTKIGLFCLSKPGGVTSNYSPREYAFGTIGLGLTDTQQSDYYDAIQAFQTALGRQV